MAQDDKTFLENSLGERTTPEAFTTPSPECMSARIHALKLATRMSYGDDEHIIANEQASLRFRTFVRLAMILRHPELHPLL